MSNNRTSQFSRFGSEKSDRPSFANGRQGNKYDGNKKDNTHSGNKRYSNNEHSEGKKERLQSGPDWFDSSDFCRTNKKAGAVMWKEELSDKMKEFPLGKSGDRIYVPIGWKFQNVASSEYVCERTGKRFMYESAFNIHNKQLEHGKLCTWFGQRNTV